MTGTPKFVQLLVSIVVNMYESISKLKGVRFTILNGVVWWFIRGYQKSAICTILFVPMCSTNLIFKINLTSESSIYLLNNVMNSWVIEMIFLVLVAT